MTAHPLSRFVPIALAAAALIFVALPGCRRAEQPMPKIELPPTKLPRVARPLHYSIAATPDPKNLRFSGSAIIDIELLEATNSVTLNAADLEFQSVALTDGANKSSDAQPSIDAPNE